MVEGSGKQRDIGSGRKLIGLEVLLDCLIACAAQDCLFLQWKDLILSFEIKMKKCIYVWHWKVSRLKIWNCSANYKTKINEMGQKPVASMKVKPVCSESIRNEFWSPFH